MIPVMALHRTYTNPMHQKSFPPPLGTRKIVHQANALYREPYQNNACTSAATLYQLVAFGSVYRVASQIHCWRWPSCIPDGPPDWFRCRRLTSSAISSSYMIDSSMGKGVTPTGMDRSGGGTFWQSTTLYVIILSMATLDGEGLRSTTYLYHPHIRIHVSFTRGELGARRESIAAPASTELHQWSPWRQIHLSNQGENYNMTCTSVQNKLLLVLHKSL